MAAGTDENFDNHCDQRLSGPTALNDLALTVERLEAANLEYEQANARLQEMQQELLSAHETLRQSEETFSIAFRRSPAVVTLSTLADGRYVEVNDRFYSMLGFTREETIGHTSFEIGIWGNPDDRGRLVQMLEENGRVIDEEIRFREKSGRVRTFLFSAEIVTISQAPHLLTMNIDITERKNAEETIRQQKEELEEVNKELKRTIRKREKVNRELLKAQEKLVAAHRLLQQSEEKFSKAFHLGPVIITLSTMKDGRYVEVSDHFLRLSEYSREEVIGHTSFDLGIWCNLEDRDRIGRIIETKGNFVEEEILFRSRYGKVYTMLFSAEVVMLMGKPHMVSVAVDLTERKRAQEALRESEEKYRILFENANEAILVAQDGRIRFMNRKTEEVLGCSREKILAVPFSEFIHPDDRERVVGMHWKRLQGGILPEIYAFRIVDRQGAVKWLEVNAVLIAWEGRPASLNFYTDVTKRKLADETIRKSEERYRTIFENTGNASILVNEDGMILLANSNFVELSGYSKEEIEGRMSWTSFVHQEDLEKMKMYHERRGKAPDSVPDSYEFRFVDRRGEERDIAVNVALIAGTNESVASLIDVTEQKRMVAALKESEERFRTIFENATEGIFQSTPAGRFLRVNPALARMLGYQSPHEVIDSVHDMGREVYANPVDRENMLEVLREKGSVQDFEFEACRRDGNRIWFSMNIHTVRDEGGNVLYLEGTNIDITKRKQAEAERRRLEEQLLQAQKMESVGRLAGGVAHDFNNMLTPIMGYAEMLLDDLAKNDPRRNNIEQVILSAERSRDLVRQLLAFARKQTLEMKPVNLNQIVSGVTSMLRHTLHENVRVEIRPADSLGAIQADTGQVEQIILNLAVNAQDAMPEGGSFVIRTGETVLDDTYAKANEDVAPGAYIMMSVTDTGTGMGKEVLRHIFEPFYTTKGAGKGTGLGLATVYGIVKQHGGHISVHSEPGAGTTFRIYFPRYGGDIAPSHPMKPKEKSSLLGTETILVVEDEDGVRDLAANVLRHYGYTVLEASDGKTAQEALLLCECVIHLLVTDVVLPDMNGRKIYEKLSLFRPGLRVLYMSGYTAEVISHHGVLDKDVHFIQKPFNLQDLARKVREIIDGDFERS